MSGLETYYNHEKGTYLLEIRLNQMQQLFNSLDPSPFLEKDLDDDAATYIVQSADEFSHRVPLKLVLYLPASEVRTAKQILPEAIHNYFEYRQETLRKKLRYVLRQGRISLMIGLAFLGICISLSKGISWMNDSFSNLQGSRTIGEILQEGLLIIGWVAMWRPVEIFLYEWFPIYQAQKLLEKLSRIPVEIRPALSSG